MSPERKKRDSKLTPLRRLENALRQYITETLCIPVTTFDDGLSDKISEMEKAYEKTKDGFWHRLWYRMGNNQDIVSAWLDLIPNEYGLFIIKAGIAVIFKVGYPPPAFPVGDAISWFLCSLASRELQRQGAESVCNFLDTSASLGELATGPCPVSSRPEGLRRCYRATRRYRQSY
jgi:hypothetical protein